jgi:hypothetical protein
MYYMPGKRTVASRSFNSHEGLAMSIKQCVAGLSYSIAAVVFAGGFPPIALGENPPVAQSTTSDRETTSHKQHTAELARVVRETTRRFRDVDVATAEGYRLMFGCVSGPDDGAMGLHYVNLDLVGDGVLDPRRPEIVIYEPLPNGGRRLIGADFLVFAESWHAKNTNTPELMGQLMHLIESPNRYGLPAFYTLHVWAWKPNANGAFVNWHPNVSCEAFDGEEH